MTLPRERFTTPLIDVAAQRARLGTRIDEAIARVLDHGRFILGPEVDVLEAGLAAATGARHAITCASGTDALLLALLAHGIGRGDAVFVPAFTFPAAAEAAALLGATPVFVDVEETYATLDPASLEAALRGLTGLRARAVVAVDLFGHTADYDAIGRVARDRDMLVIADAAQSFGAASTSGEVGTLGDIAITSFYPSKPLACYGDGGCVFTACDDAAAAVRSLRVHGQDTGGIFARIGINGRLDTIQAAILIEKLAICEEERAARERIAARYATALGNVVGIPRTAPGCRHAWACYTIRSPHRDAIDSALNQSGIATAVYYRTPLHRQPAYRGFGLAPEGAPVAERLATEVLSLPVHAYLDEATQDLIVERIRDVTG